MLHGTKNANVSRFPILLHTDFVSESNDYILFLFEHWLDALFEARDYERKSRNILPIDYAENSEEEEETTENTSFVQGNTQNSGHISDRSNLEMHPDLTDSDWSDIESNGKNIELLFEK